MKMTAALHTNLRAIIKGDQKPLDADAMRVADAIHKRHGGAVRALVFYGSALRPDHGEETMFDFYVLVSRYRDVYANPAIRYLNALLPGGVHYLEIAREGGRVLRSKYAVISLAAFHRRTRGAALESMLWARFAQSAIIVCGDEDERERLIDTLAGATLHFARETAPLLSGKVEAAAFWQRALCESYRTELRPEDPAGRACSIVDSDPERYEALARAFFPAAGGRHIVLPDPGVRARQACRLRWFVRRVLGKPAGALRIAKATLTFGVRLDYILEKVEKHSGVRIEVSEAERRRPLLHAPAIAWRMLCRRAVR